MGGCLSKKEPKDEPRPKNAEGNDVSTQEASAVKLANDGAAAPVSVKPDGGGTVDENDVKEIEKSPAANEMSRETPAQSPDEGSGSGIAEPETPAQPSAVDGGIEKGGSETPAQSPDVDRKLVVFVLGASGSVGSATVKVLSEEYAQRVEIRAGVRNPEGVDKLKGLPGVELVQASMSDKESLLPALSGVSVLYIVTPGTENRPELVALSADAAKEAGVKHIVVVSGSVVGLTDTLFGRQWTAIENKVSGLDIPYTILRLHYFFDNFLINARSVKAKGEFSSPFPGNKPFTVVDASDVGRASAAVLTDPVKHEGKSYDIISDRITNEGIAAALSSLLEKEVKFVYQDIEAVKSTYAQLGVPGWQITGLVDFARLICEGHPQVNLENTGDYKELTGKEPTSLQEYLTSRVFLFK